MATRPTSRAKFPYYLNKPDKNLLVWIGKFLRDFRGKKRIKTIASEAKVNVDDVQDIEDGTFHLSLGRIRDILHHGYGCTLEDVLVECFNAHKKQFDPEGDRCFERDWHYRLRRSDKRITVSESTPLLIGGDPEKFLWAVPMRRLNKQPLVTEFLELAPARKRKNTGVTSKNTHGGVEVIYVIHGEIQVYIKGGEQGTYEKPLKSGESVHFNCCYKHNIENHSRTTSSLLQIVRLPQNPTSKS